MEIGRIAVCSEKGTKQQIYFLGKCRMPMLNKVIYVYDV